MTRQASFPGACSQFVNALCKKHGIADEEILANTPRRIEQAWNEFLNGYSQSPSEILSKTFKTKTPGMVVVSGLDFISICQHHLLLFSGTISIGYIPNRSKVVGLSKLPRLVDCLSHRLQIQENLGSEIADAIMLHLKPKGVGVKIVAQHSCCNHRGIKKPNATMTTASLRGIFNDQTVRKEFYDLL